MNGHTFVDNLRGRFRVSFRGDSLKGCKQGKSGLKTGKINPRGRTRGVKLRFRLLRVASMHQTAAFFSQSST